jgi:two-component system OmpR family sensor kinase
VLGAVLVLSALFQYLALRRFLIGSAVARLQSEVRAAGPQPPDGLVRALTDPRTSVWVLAPDGRVLASSPGAAETGVDPRSVAFPASIGGGELAVRVPLRPGQSVVLATSLQDVAGVLSDEVRLLALGGLAALVAAAFAAAWTLARGLRPLQGIAEVADAVSAGSLDRRADLGGLPAELAAVAAALNGMLDRLAGALRQERAAHEQLRRFLADASHELRTPLTAILGYLELWRQGTGRGEAEMEAGLTSAHGQARRMAGLVDGLLALARVEEGSQRREPFDLRKALAELRGESPQVDWPGPGAPVPVVGDRDAVLRAVRNLVGNALKFGPPDGPVEVALRQEGGFAVIEVADRGPGIPPEDLPHIFERFYRGRTGRPGSGLGLAIVAAVAAAHGGRAEMLQRPGGGTIARLWLPTAVARS